MKVCALIIISVALSLVQAAPHKPSCVCSSQYDPVCSPSGKTYSNECLARCDRVDLSTLEQGECPRIQPVRTLDRKPDCFCMQVFAPVCGNGNTYSNECEARCARVDLSTLEQGECPHIQPVRTLDRKPDCVCMQVFAPVCGNGNTYSNECEARCARVDPTTLEQGECPHIQPVRTLDRKPDCFCIQINAPVCGNGNTYSNECEARCAGATRIESGGCPHILPVISQSESPDCNCIGLYDPVCGDGVTYPNACRARCARVKSVEAGGCINILPFPSLENVRTQRGCPCDRKWEPVCSGGITYSNYCVAHCYNKYNLKAGEC